MLAHASNGTTRCMRQSLTGQVIFHVLHLVVDMFQSRRPRGYEAAPKVHRNILKLQV